MTCITCGEIYTREEVEEWKEKGKDFSVSEENFICPGCTVKLLQRPSEKTLNELMNTILTTH